MSERPGYEPFACAPGLKLQAHEKLTELHYAQLREQLGKLEDVMQRIERRMWLAVYGVAAAIVAQAAQHVMN